MRSRSRLFSRKTYELERRRNGRRWQGCEGWTLTPSVSLLVVAFSTSERIAESPFVVLDFDKIPTIGKEPETPEERKRLVCESLAIARWLREECGWSLSAILWTGSKSLHIWFEMPPEDHVAALTESMATLGIDPSLIGMPEHPARLPGVTHKKTGKRSKTLWLQK